MLRYQVIEARSTKVLNMISDFIIIVFEIKLVVCMIYIMLITFSSNPLFWLKLASNRVINPIQSDERHPWLACLFIQEQKVPDIPEERSRGLCTGAVISKRYDY